jgi:radical SAM protein with 4Fe4S-binding SPASM domain
MQRTVALDTLILFVTSRCNSKCKTCFYWEELNRDDDLTFSELEEFSRTMPRFNEMWISGGEPTLRQDLPDVLSRFYQENGVRSINLPVNGLLPSKLIEQVESIHRLCPELRMNVNVALDGLDSTHDQLRGVPQNFNRAMESLETLQNLRKTSPELRVHVNSVVCRDNFDEMLPLGELIRERFDLDGHYFQLIRGEPMEPGLLDLHKEAIRELYGKLQPLYRHYAEKLKTRKGSFGAAVSEVAYLGTLNLYHEIQAANLDGHHPWPMACTAGQNIVVVDANGDIRSCEMRERLGNLRDFQCDWNAFWESQKRMEELDAIVRDGCWCTHVCFIHASMKESTKARWFNVPKAYLASTP